MNCERRVILFGAREEASHEPSGSRLTRARQNRRQVDFLTRPEIEAILAAPDRTTWLGRRDYTLLLPILSLITC